MSGNKELIECARKAGCTTKEAAKHIEESAKHMFSVLINAERR